MSQQGATTYGQPCILGCSIKKRSKVCHRFPNSERFPELFKAWCKVVPEDKKPLDYTNKRICGNHFLEKDKYHHRLLYRNTLPVLCLPGQPSTHNNCNCDRELVGVPETSIDNEDEHKHVPVFIDNEKYSSQIKPEHAYHSQPQKEDETINYVPESEIETCINLTNANNEFGKIGEIEDVTNIINSLEYALSDFYDEPIHTLSDADDARVTENINCTNIKPTRPHNQTGQTTKGVSSSDIPSCNELLSDKLVSSKTKNSKTTITNICNTEKKANKDNETASTITSAHIATPNSSCNVVNDKSLQQSECSIVHVNSKTNAKTFKQLQENSFTIPNICRYTDANYDIVTDNKRIANLISDTKYSVSNVSGSLKHPQFVGVVGSTIIVTEESVPNVVEPLEDPLAIDNNLGFDHCLDRNEDNMEAGKYLSSNEDCASIDENNSDITNDLEINEKDSMIRSETGVYYKLNGDIDLRIEVT